MLDSEQLERLLLWASGKPANPFRMEINPTDRCNLNCIFCKRQNLTFDYSLEVEDHRLIELVEEARKLDVREWRIVGGGEPMVRLDATVNLMLLIKKYHMRGYMITNGTIFPREVVKYLVQAEWDNITYSIDSPFPEVQDRLRGKKGAFNSAIQTLQFFSEYKRKLNKIRPFICLHLVLCKENYLDIIPMIDLAKKMDCGFIFVQPLNIYHQLGAELALSDEQKDEFKSQIPQLIEYASKLGIGTNLETFLDVEMLKKSDSMGEVIMDDVKKRAEELTITDKFLNLPCFEPWVGMVVRPGGNVGPCCVFEGKGENVKEKSLKEIWFGEYFTNLRDLLLNQKLPLFCAQCGVAMVVENKNIRDLLAIRLKNSKKTPIFAHKNWLGKILTSLRAKMLSKFS